LCAGEKWADKLRSEYEKALEKLNSVKEEYLIVLKNGFNSMIEEYERNIEKGIRIFCEEYLTNMHKIHSLKTEYLKAMDNANFLKDELAEIFKQASLFNRLNAEKI
jgi:hypothetical protein